MAITFQFITLGIIIILGIYLFKKYPIKITTKLLIQVTFLVALSLVLSYFSMMLSIGGFPSLKIGFSQIPLMLIGLVYGPTVGFIAGLAYDLLGLIITPTGFPFFGFTLTNILVCVLPGFIGKKTNEKNKKILLSVFIICYVAIISIFAYIVVFSDLFVVDATILQAKTRMMVSIGALINIILILVVLYLIKKKYGAEADLAKILESTIIIDGGVNLFLNPLWLKVMYEIPYIVSISTRFIKLLVILPLDTIILLTLYKAMKRIRKE